MIACFFVWFCFGLAKRIMLNYCTRFVGMRHESHHNSLSAGKTIPYRTQTNTHSQTPNPLYAGTPLRYCNEIKLLYAENIYIKMPYKQTISKYIKCSGAMCNRDRESHLIRAYIKYISKTQTYKYNINMPSDSQVLVTCSLSLLLLSPSLSVVFRLASVNSDIKRRRTCAHMYTASSAQLQIHIFSVPSWDTDRTSSQKKNRLIAISPNRSFLSLFFFLSVYFLNWTISACSLYAVALCGFSFILPSSFFFVRSTCDWLCDFSDAFCLCSTHWLRAWLRCVNVYLYSSPISVCVSEIDENIANTARLYHEPNTYILWYDARTHVVEAKKEKKSAKAFVLGRKWTTSHNANSFSLKRSTNNHNPLPEFTFVVFSVYFCCCCYQEEISTECRPNRFLT